MMSPPLKRQRVSPLFHYPPAPIPDSDQDIDHTDVGPYNNVHEMELVPCKPLILETYTHYAN